MPLWRDEKGLAILAGTPLHGVQFLLSHAVRDLTCCLLADELHRIRTKLTERHTALSTFLSGVRTVQVVPCRSL